jgi:hypothetical protein
LSDHTRTKSTIVSRISGGTQRPLRAPHALFFCGRQLRRDLGDHVVLLYELGLELLGLGLEFLLALLGPSAGGVENVAARFSRAWRCHW